MDPDELREGLKNMATGAPEGSTRARELVMARARSLHRRRRAAQVGAAALSVVVVAAGIAWWRSDSGPEPTTVIAPSTTSTPPRGPSTSVTTAPVSTSSPSPTTSTTIATPTSGVIAAEAGYVFVGTPVVTGGALYALEGPSDNITYTGSRVARVDLQTQKVVATSSQPGAVALVFAADTLWVGTGVGNGGPYGGPTITRVVGLRPADFGVRSSIDIPAPGADGLAVSPRTNSVWALSGANVVRIDRSPSQLFVSETVHLDLPASNPHRTLAVSDDGAHLYVGWTSPTTMADTVTEYDAAGLREHQSGPVGGGPSDVGPQLVYSGSRLWVAFPTGTEASAVALSPSDLSTTGESITGPQWLAVAPVGRIVWASRSNSLDCVDAHGATIAAHGTPDGIVSAAAPTPRAMYVTTSTGIAVVATSDTCPG